MIDKNLKIKEKKETDYESDYFVIGLVVFLIVVVIAVITVSSYFISGYSNKLSEIDKAREFSKSFEKEKKIQEKKIQGRKYVRSYYPIYSYPYKDYIGNNKINDKNAFILGEGTGWTFSNSYFTLADYKDSYAIREFVVEKDRVNFIRTTDEDTIPKIRTTEIIFYTFAKNNKDTIFGKRETLYEIDFLIPRSKRVFLVNIGELKNAESMQKINNMNNNIFHSRN